MNRQEYLLKNWKPYSTVSGEKTDCSYGRVFQIEKDKIILKIKEDFVSLEISSIGQSKDKDWGESIMPGQLCVGDVVAFNKDLRSLFLLSPCLHPSPHLFSDRALKWEKFSDQILNFFKTYGFNEVRTPYLVSSPGVDHHIDFFQVSAGKRKKNWFLPTSPEIHLKKHLCRGLENIFELKHCFRDDLPGRHHQSEFLMLEWYRSFCGLDSIQKDIENLLIHLLGHEMVFNKMTVSQCFERFVGFSLRPDSSLSELFAWAKKLGIHTESDDQWNDVFFRIFMERVEPGLESLGAVFLYNFPYQQASLAQINAKTGWAERFEFYWKGVELANAYLEVNDPQVNRQRFEAEQALRLESNKEASSLDAGFFTDLLSGHPPASGVAMGVDRLFMLLSKEKTLEDCAWCQ